MADSNKGVWFDTQANKVVHSEPVEGIQLAAPGTEITPSVQASIDAYAGTGEVGVVTVSGKPKGKA